MATPVIRLRIDLAYDGAPFAGFARQPDQTTVQGTLEAVLTRLTGQEARTTCAGRTDRGVHALAQVVHVDLAPTSPRVARLLGDLDGLRRRLDAMVGPPVAIWRVRVVGDDFDARFSATARGYRYRLADTVVLDPLARHDRWHVGERLALGAMQQAGRPLLGEHDYAAFCRRAPDRHSVRRIDRLTVARTGPGEVQVRLAGPAFCHQQVRAIVGCLAEVGRGRKPPDWVGEVLDSRDRGRAARVAPAHGLTLERVTYGRRWPAAPPAAVPER